MKIVWISNAQPFSLPNSVKTSSGGWLQEQYSSLCSSNYEIDILAFFPDKQNKCFLNRQNNFITFKPVKNNILSIYLAKSFFKSKLNVFKPDLIHIHGTELPHCYSMSLAAKELNIPYVVSLQGIVSEIYKHVLTGIEPNEIFKKSLRDIIFGSSTIGLRKLYRKLSILEKKIVLNSKIVIGRTNWDKAWITFNFKNKIYKVCHEPIRKEFLIDQKWDYKNCKKYHIFLSQSNTSIKGLHILLHSIKYLINYYPDTKLIIAGKDYKKNTLRNLLFRTSYENTILKIIKKNKLENHIKFLGPQNVYQMIDNLLLTNCFVQPSVIENSPNSLMEAVYLNVPSVAANVGGVSFLYSEFNNVYLYQSDSALMLANEIMNVFEKKLFKPNNFQVNNEHVGSNLLDIYNAIKYKNNYVL
jgi:glycosyltransferase involved in cell wall biosynthesis